MKGMVTGGYVVPILGQGGVNPQRISLNAFWEVITVSYSDSVPALVEAFVV